MPYKPCALGNYSLAIDHSPPVENVASLVNGFLIHVVVSHRHLHEIIRRWGWVTLVLTPDEKLIARSLINAERAGKPQPNVTDIAKAADLSEVQVNGGLAMLERYEILQRAAANGGGYKIVSRYIKWEPRLDFIFHKVTLDRAANSRTRRLQ